MRLRRINWAARECWRDCWCSMDSRQPSASKQIGMKSNEPYSRPRPHFILKHLLSRLLQVNTLAALTTALLCHISCGTWEAAVSYGLSGTILKPFQSKSAKRYPLLHTPMRRSIHFHSLLLKSRALQQESPCMDQWHSLIRPYSDTLAGNTPCQGC